MKKIIFTGGKGFFCTRLAEYYKHKYQILSLGKDELNVTDKERVISVFKEFRPDYVLHAGAIALTDYCNKHPEIAHKINVEGAANVAEAAKEVKAKIVFASSEQVFNGNKERGPYDENHKAVPNTVYGENKLEAEELIKKITDEVWILRFTWMFGMPKENYAVTSNIMWDTISSVLREEKIKAPVNEYRGMTYVNEMIENFEKVFDIPYGTYHMGSRNDLNRYEVVKLIIEELGIKNDVHKFLEADTEKYKDNIRDIRLNTEKISKYNIKFLSTEEAVKRCINEEICGDIEKYRSMLK